MASQDETKGTYASFPISTKHAGMTAAESFDVGGNDIKTVFQRYSTGFKALKNSPWGRANPYKPDNLEDGIADFACFYALQPNAFDEKASQLGACVLISALLITVSLPTYFSPSNEYDSCDDDETCNKHMTYRVFAGLMLCSSALFFISILFSVFELMLLTRPYTEVDTLVTWLTIGRPCDLIVQLSNYAGVILLVLGAMIFGYLAYPPRDANLYLIVMGASVVIIMYGAIKCGSFGTEIQQGRIKTFLSAFCDRETGELRPEFQGPVKEREAELADAIDRAVKSPET